MNLNSEINQILIHLVSTGMGPSGPCGFGIYERYRL